MRKILLSAIVGFLLILAPVLADSNTTGNSQICLDSTTLQSNINVTINGNANIISTNQACTFGCDLANNRCNDPPINILIIVIMSVISLSVLAIVVYRKVS